MTLRNHWAEFGPPVYRSAALYLGYVQAKPKAPKADDEPFGDDDFAEFMTALAPGGWW